MKTLQEMNPKAIAFYLPQFHRIPENDKWWGEGFTEWTNTRRSVPLFKGHEQPREPLDDYYYDLLDPQAQAWQAKIAKDHGLSAFCYYHYWFNGRRLLEKPLEQVLQSQEPDFPFCLAWANEPWTRTWEGNNRDVLVAQEYGAEVQWQAHIDYLLGIFKDRRYLKVDGKPMFLIYRPSAIPRLNEMIKLWRQIAQKAGYPGIHLVGMKTIFAGANESYDFDHWVDFEPLYTYGRCIPLRHKFIRKFFGLASRASRKISPLWPKRPQYKMLWDLILKRPFQKNSYLGAFVNWDNSARKGKKALIVSDFTPELFKLYFGALVRKARLHRSEFVFINAWNEWAEGSYLEPDKRHGYAYLEAIKEGLAQPGDNDQVKSRGAVLKI